VDPDVNLVKFYSIFQCMKQCFPDEIQQIISQVVAWNPVKNKV